MNGKTAQLIDGKSLSASEIVLLRDKFDALPFKACLAVVLVGENPASQVYVRNKHRFIDQIGADFKLFSMPADSPKEAVVSMIRQLNKDSDIHGILLQLPLPDPLPAMEIIAEIDPAKDVDGLHPLNAGYLLDGNDAGFVPCTPMGMVKLIKTVKPDLSGLHAVVIGRSILVGKPMALLLLQENCTVTVAHSKTKDLSAQVKQADIVICATGQPGLVTGAMIKPGAVVIDAGITRLPDKTLVGDADFQSVLQTAGYLTPVPGGVGPMTVWGLGANLYKAALTAQRRSSK